MRPPHLTTELDALFLLVLRRACVETEVPECLREAIAGILSGSMDLYTANEEHNPRNLKNNLPDNLEAPWRDIADALHLLAPIGKEKRAHDLFRAPRRSVWEADARESLNIALRALAALPNCPYETPTPD